MARPSKEGANHVSVCGWILASGMDTARETDSLMGNKKAAAGDETASPDESGGEIWLIRAVRFIPSPSTRGGVMTTVLQQIESGTLTPLAQLTLHWNNAAGGAGPLRWPLWAQGAAAARADAQGASGAYLPPEAPPCRLVRVGDDDGSQLLRTSVLVRLP